VLALLQVDWIGAVTFIIALAKLLIANQAVKLVCKPRVSGALHEVRGFPTRVTLEIMVEDTLEALLRETTRVDQIVFFVEYLSTT